MRQAQAASIAEEDNRSVFGDEEERNLYLCIENFKNGSFLHRYLHPEPWLKCLYLALIEQMHKRNHLQSPAQSPELGQRQSMESVEEAIEEEQMDEDNSHHQVLVNDQHLDDTQTENSFYQEEHQESEQEQGPATDRMLGQKRTFPTIAASEVPTATCTQTPVSEAPKAQKKRGRKAMDKEELRQKMEAKIAQMQAEYNKANENGLTSMQKLKLRNHIQAQKSRMRKYDQKAQQDREVLSQNQRAIQFMKMLEEELGESDKDRVYASLRMVKRTSGSQQDNDLGEPAQKIQKI